MIVHNRITTAGFSMLTRLEDIVPQLLANVATGAVSSGGATIGTGIIQRLGLSPFFSNAAFARLAGTFERFTHIRWPRLTPAYDRVNTADGNELEGVCEDLLALRYHSKGSGQDRFAVERARCPRAQPFNGPPVLPPYKPTQGPVRSRNTVTFKEGQSDTFVVEPGMTVRSDNFTGCRGVVLLGRNSDGKRIMSAVHEVPDDLEFGAFLYELDRFRKMTDRGNYPAVKAVFVKAQMAENYRRGSQQGPEQRACFEFYQEKIGETLGQVEEVSLYYPIPETQRNTGSSSMLELVLRYSQLMQARERHSLVMHIPNPTEAIQYNFLGKSGHL